MKILTRLFLIVLLSGIAWLTWQKPAPAPEPAAVSKSMPARPVDQTGTVATASQSTATEKTMWRVITRRVVSKDGILALERRLTRMGLAAIKFENQETTVMHAFDDAILFKSRNRAKSAASFWQTHGIETSLIYAAEARLYLVGLGRFYQQKYAEGMRTRLDNIGRKYRYQQRTVPIPAWRYTFKASDKASAEALWEKLETTGVMMPVLMPEKQFQALYGKAKKSAVH